MAIELCQDASMSPRISFSNDLCQSGGYVPIEQGISRSNSSRTGNNDFFFPVHENFYQEHAAADELFCDGKLLPIEIKSPCTSKRMYQPIPPLSNLEIDVETSKKDVLQEEKITTTSKPDGKQNSKSFWQFKRSRSLGCTSTLCPLSLLSRSNSTGSAPHKKHAQLGKDIYGHKQIPKRMQSFASMKSSESSYLISNQKPPLKKNYRSYTKGGIPISPVINVSSGNMFGLGSLFNGKTKAKK